jgi:DNA-binding NarL/FixJ family response regulator
MIRVLLIDDHPIVHDGIIAVLRAEADIRVIGSAETVERAIAQLTGAAGAGTGARTSTGASVSTNANANASASASASSEMPEVVLLDLRLPGEEGVTGVRRLLAAFPDLNVIVFTAYDVDEYVFGAIQAGAKGYLLKGSPAPELVRAIRHVSAGGTYLSPTIGAKLASHAVRGPRRETSLLTPRELAVLRLVAAGLSNRQIADSLGITERTVKFHVTAIFNKLGADNRAQAVALAGRRGLLPI